MSKNISIETRKTVLRKMIRCRSRILGEYPFYGYLVMHLQLGVTDCGTACTDMKHLMFDPDFAERLSDDEMIFVMLHEVLHCSLLHCTRGRNYQSELFNIAADIVVNSNILYSLGIPEFNVAGIPAMHTTPDGQEGFHFSAEEVYKMLLQNTPPLCIEGGLAGDIPSGCGVPDDMAGDGESEDEGSSSSGPDTADESFDSHDLWSSVEENDAKTDQWKKLTIDGGKKYSSAEMPLSVREYVLELERESKVDWRTVLQDFIQLYHDRFDYSFTPSDRRYTWSDFVMPAFSEQDDERVENLWFCVDTSGSISQEMLSDVMSEIRQAILLFDRLSGKVSFFDTHITEPIPFEDEEDLLDIPAVGGGGTSFDVIFRYLKNFGEEEMPSAIIVLTDGYCKYPPEEAALDIPVLWIISGNEKDPPWGRFVHINAN